VLPPVSEDAVDRRDGDRGLGADCVVAPGAQLLERVGGVAGEHDVVAVIVDADDRHVPGCVAGRGHCDDASVVAELAVGGEGAERIVGQRHGLEAHVGRDGLTEHALEDPRHRAPGEGDLGWVDEHRGPCEVDGAVHVVAVHVRQYDRVDLIWCQAE
jgi:hypothetical protein